MKNLLSIILLLTLSTLAFTKTIDLTKSKGTNQTTIVSLTPSLSQIDVDKDITIKAVFNIELDSKHVKKLDIKLKNLSTKKKKIIKGKVSYIPNEKTVSFKPNEALEVGYYEVEFKSLKTLKTKKHIKIKEIKYRFYVPEVINGHKLPPEPDQTLNDSTLLGVDLNNNGVRDDVERKIYLMHSKPLQQGLLMQRVRFYQLTLLKPLSEAQKTQKYVSREIDCQIYLGRIDDEIGADEWMNVGDYFKNLTLNTKERVKKYLDYNIALSGGSYGSSPSDWNAEACDFNVTQIIQEF